MTFLHRLAHRIARLKTRVLAFTTVAVACSQGERTDFLSPVPNQPSSNLQRVLIQPKIAAIQAGSEFRFTASALNSSGATVPASFDWSAESGTISSDGSYVGVVPGPFRVFVRSHDRPELADTAVIAVWLNETDPTGLSIQPADITVEEGDTLTFGAFLNLANGVQAAGATVSWNTTGGSVNPSGLYTAPSTPGEYLVSASTSNGYTGSATVKVRPRSALAADVQIAPSQANVAPNQGVQFSATTTYSDGKPGPGIYLWSTSLGTITQSGAFTAGASEGTAEVLVNLAGTNFIDTAKVVVGAQAPGLVSLRVAPKPVTIQAGGVQQFTVFGTLSNGTSVRPTVTWIATGGSISMNGLYSAGSVAGTYRVIAVQQGGTLADTSVVRVEAPTVVALGITPQYTSVTPGGSQQFTASATWSNGSTILPPVTWSATGGTVSSNGLFTAGSTPGTYRVIVAGGGKADTSSVSIGAPRTLVSLALNPGSGQTVTGGTIQFTAAALWSDGSNTLPSLIWSATGGTVTSAGSYTAGSTAGTYRVIVTGGGKADTAAVTVAPSGGSPTPALVLTMAPDVITLPVGEGQYFSVAALWPDGSTTLPSLTWSASEGSVSNFLNGGYFTPPAKAGTYRVIVTANGAADTASVTVTGGSSAPATLTSLTLTPALAAVSPGSSQMFTASAIWSNGSTTLPALTWSATGGTVTQNGLYTAGSNAGTFSVIVSGGGKADTAIVTVGSPAVVTTFRLFPENVSLGLGQTQQFTTSTTWSDGVSRPVSVTYSASGGLMSVGGLFTAGQLLGTFSVIASCTCGRADTSVVTIVNSLAPPTLTSLTINPRTVSLSTGGTQQFSAAALWSNGSTTLPTLSWTSTGGVISSTGLFSSGSGTGVYQVTVSGGGRSDVATVSVGPALPPPPPPQGSGSALRAFDPERFSNPSTFLMDSRTSWSQTSDAQPFIVAEEINVNSSTVTLAAPPEGGYGGRTKVMRYNFPQTSAQDFTISRGFALGSNLPDSTMIWLETVVRFAPNFSRSYLGGAGPGSRAYKIARLSRSSTSPLQVDFPIGDAMGGEFISPLVQANYSVPTAFFNSGWHTIRMQGKWGPGGVFKLWLDGQLVYSVNGPFGSGVENWYISGPRNCNKGWGEATYMDIGLMRLFTSDPGW